MRVAIYNQGKQDEIIVFRTGVNTKSKEERLEFILIFEWKESVKKYINYATVKPVVLELEARYVRLLDAWAYEAKMAGSSSGKVPNLGLDSQDFDINPDQITGLDITSLQQLLDLKSSDEEVYDSDIEVSIIQQVKS
ncbi:hypothetical protein ElyMa_004824500 [Elysia marginata]|uniref:Uncharacterized protein n=1 Tax=Elysia marginata TaxID=1093978 RepID=A0AAV4INM1_9GAST|nr:hypothetical protein ElyMa_004824500 [Elysia marginata]